MEETELIESCKKADVSAMKVIYEKYYRIMFGICLRYVRNKADAEDLVQDGFMKIFKDIGTFQGRGSFEGWMKKVMINSSLSYLRKPRKEIETENFADFSDADYPNDEASEITVKDQIMATDFSREELIETIQTLPMGYQQVLNLYVIDDYKHQEISEMLNISIGTSKSQLNRGRKLLIKKLHQISLNKNKEHLRSDYNHEFTSLNYL